MATYNVTLTVSVEDKAEFMAWANALAEGWGGPGPKTVTQALMIASGRLAEADGLMIVDEDVTAEDDEDED